MEVNGVSQNLAKWAERLKDLTLSPLTRDYPELSVDENPKLKRSIEAVEALSTTNDFIHALKKLDSTISPFRLLLTAYALLISRLTGDSDISIATNAETDGKPLILRVPVTSDESFAHLTSKIQSYLTECTGEIEPLADICSHLKTPTLFRFAAFHTSKSSTYVTGIAGDPDLRLHITTTSGGGVQLLAKYNQRLFASARIATILSQILQIIENASINPNESIGRIELLTTRQKQLLPDPTRDLGWNDFRGAIHDIFSENAESHPEKPCVIETKSESSPQRTFSYRHINEASNILAHHFVKQGLQRGEVVMIYSHRGVDLVVAVMGILKAGGTFSVLDPAYPADRQNVYLEVAKPRALVVIEKATVEAGEISEKVRSFIAENLDLRTEIPALALRDDGTLVGGEVDGYDILSHVNHLKDKGTGVVVGPDSTPTLSFTSGSEGKPKGVRGRHFSLAYYFDWMAKTFHLSKDDKFTMLSGIAHDPIQRDMFTPLFLGAQLLVPSKNDIQNEKLAEWMRGYGATVTHLTPAMGQILVGGATAKFEKLHHAFFVGDILIKRDCRSLQSLAPNVNIVNMYGTTETQRAVSYFEIPCFSSHEGYLDGMKDVIPAGKGMYNVQLLVVNRFDRTKLCAVGEVGEIYVRAGGLAEGYLGTPDLTEKKFVKNWFTDPDKWMQDYKTRTRASEAQPWQEFYLGPRDRLYRSGDLGRYTPTGDVECSGRADDQVKIRGFRIELGEIDTHLSQHALIRENITLVRRDKFEEQTLVSYVVPDMKAWASFIEAEGIKDEQDDGSIGGRFRRFTLLRQRVQEYLKTKLPVYAVPSVVVPMRSMPLNPNGKIDKPKLPFPDIGLLNATRQRKSSVLTQLTETELALSKIWAKLIPGIFVRTLRPADSFFDLGGTSMHAQQLPFNVRRVWRGVDISISQIYRNPTMKDMAALIDRFQDASALDGDSDNDPQNISQGQLEIPYSEDAIQLKKLLPAQFQRSATQSRESRQNSTSTNGTSPPTLPRPSVFLTGATGFLGAYILRDLLQRREPEVSVTTLVRAKSPEAALDRIRSTCQAYGVWSESWTSRLKCIPGSLDKAGFGMAEGTWDIVAQEIDVVIHNGAQVHWINPYSVLKPANVMGTIEALKLCASGKPKRFAFVSSTSVLDTDHFVFESERIIAAGGEGISEADDLLGSRTTLTTGYGQSKWVAEYLIRESGKRGLEGCIVRPGYVTGDSKSGVTNTDDFLIRMVKGCIQLSSRPNINNTVNMVPVDHVAHVVVACAFRPPQPQMSVAHVTGHPRLRFNQFLAALETYGYNVPVTDYIPWTGALENYVSSANSERDSGQLALMPLFTFVANDLPSNTRAPELDDTNAERALYADYSWSGEDVSAGTGVTKTTIGIYLAYLVAIGFLPPPLSAVAGEFPQSIKQLPRIPTVPATQKSALARVGGRGGLG